MKPFQRTYYIICKVGQNMSYAYVRSARQYATYEQALAGTRWNPRKQFVIMQLTEIITPAFVPVVMCNPTEPPTKHKPGKKIRKVTF